MLAVPESGVKGAHPALSFVYGLFFLPLNVYIYIGSTDEFDVREGAHFSYRGNARRVAIVFAQKWFQPLKKFFRLDKLWSGHVEDKTELHAIEQHFMDKHDTRIEHRSREPTLSKDLDLMDESTPPRQLNINRACANESLVVAAAARVQHDLQLAVVPTEREQMKARHILEELWYEAVAAEPGVPVVLRELIFKYQEAREDIRFTAGEVYGDLVRLRNAATVEDGSDFHWMLNGDLLKFSVDRNADGSWPPQLVAAVFAALAAAQGSRVNDKKRGADALHRADVRSVKKQEVKGKPDDFVLPQTVCRLCRRTSARPLPPFPPPSITLPTQPPLPPSLPRSSFRVRHKEKECGATLRRSKGIARARPGGA